MDFNIVEDIFSEIIEQGSSELYPDLEITTENHLKNTEPTEYQCFHCFLKFESHIDMLDHIEAEHFTFVCEKCNKHFPTDKRLKQHLRDAHLTGKFPCPLCHKLFSRKDHCKDHIYTHSDKPLFPCEYENCNKVFRRSVNLKQHERIHTESYRKQCPICNESIVYLSKHMKSHLQTKEHACSRCDKTFSRRCYLQEHEKIHLGQVGFICEECKLEFRSSIALYKHKRSKHNAERYICEFPECSKVYNRKDNMMSHMRRKHNLRVVEVIKGKEGN